MLSFNFMGIKLYTRLLLGMALMALFSQVAAVDQSSPDAVAREMSSVLKSERFDDIASLMLPLELGEESGLLAGGKLESYKSELEGIEEKGRAYKALLDKMGFSYGDSGFSPAKPIDHPDLEGVKVCSGVGYDDGKIKVREFIDRLYFVRGKWYIYQLVDDRHLSRD